MANQEPWRKQPFSCPVSTHVAWHWGLVYKDCPVVSQERDIDECRSCPLRGEVDARRDRGKPRRDDKDGDKGRRPPGKPGRGWQDKGKRFAAEAKQDRTGEKK
jgi:hypothetical protein